MSMFKSEETSELDKVNEVEGEIREFVRRDAALARPRPEHESDLVAGNIGSLLQRVSGTSVQEIDRLIAELETLRARLQQESARVQREIVEYATLSQAAMQSTRIIAESLTRWKRVPGDPAISE